MSDKKFTVKYAAISCLAACLILFGTLRLRAQETLPEPRLVLTEKKDVVNRGYEMTSYRLEVENKFDYSSELFEAAPDLPSCGRNQNASRAWIDIFSENGKRIYGYCAIKSPDELNKLIFLFPRKNKLDKVYIIIYDRRTNQRAKSQSVAVNEN